MYKAIVSLKTGKRSEIFLNAYNFKDAYDQLLKNEEVSIVYSIVTLEAVIKA